MRYVNDITMYNNVYVISVYVDRIDRVDMVLLTLLLTLLLTSLLTSLLTTHELGTTQIINQQLP